MRVIVVDDSLLTRSGIVALLSAAHIDVVGEAADASSALRAALDTGPDAAVIDIRMPPTHTDEGLRLAIELREQVPQAGILVLSQYLDSSYAGRLLEDLPERSGYLLKDNVGTPGVLTDALRRVTAGDTVVDPMIVTRLMGNRTARDPVTELPPREREVLALVAQGLSNRAIAAQLFVTERTVEFHIAQLFLRLGLPPDDTSHRRVLAVIAFLRHARGEQQRPAEQPHH